MDKTINRKVLLLIEDNPLLTGMYKSTFEKQGIEVLFAHDGETGLKIAQERQPDLILMDVLMPGMNGLTALKKLKEHPKTKNIGVVILTITKEAEYQQEAKKLGVLDYLIKSDMKLDEIVERILKHLEMEKQSSL